MPASAWPLWRKLLFRFFFTWFALQLAPVTWINIDWTPVNYINDLYWNFIDWMVNAANSQVFHIRERLVPMNGSGDTSFVWAQECLFLSISAIVCLTWSLLDRKRKHYEVPDYWLRTFIRYGLILVSFSYGGSKLFALQMPYPSQSLMATPLGELLPMRLSWVFLGYSTGYQVFCGVMELMVGTLLLFRRTTTAGLLLGLCVYTNVMLLNLFYDIPVKLFAIHYVFYCLYLLGYQSQRLVAFFLLNKIVLPETGYPVSYPKKWTRISKVTLKFIFILFWVLVPVLQSYEEYAAIKDRPAPIPFNGVYDIILFSVNGLLIPPGAHEDRWQDIIFEADQQGSIKTSDTAFRQRYHRGYFHFEPDTTKSEIALQHIMDNGEPELICTLHYAYADNNRIRLHTQLHGDSLYMEMEQSKRHFQLAENQFHWLSESNR